MRKRIKSVAVVATALAVSVTVTGCGSSGGSKGQALSGVNITVGSKDFTENILLGKMLVKALEAQGANVTDKTNLGGTSVNRKALQSGDINVYPDYNGTGWTVFLGNSNPSQDPQKLYTETANEDLQKNKIKWVGLSPFNDTYGFATSGAFAKKNGGAFSFDTMAAYLKKNPSATVCMESEFPDRPDGLILWEKATGYKIPQSQIKILDTGLIYTQTANGACDFGEIFTTDGRITGLKMSLVKDPGVMIVYNSSFTFQDPVFEKHAKTYQMIADKIFKGLDNAEMAKLNAEVDVQGMQADQVADNYVKSIGLE